MAWSRRGLLAAVGAAAVAGCAGRELAGSATPAPAAFEARAVGADAIELRYTGIGGQDPTRFRVVLTGGGGADGTYPLDAVTDDARWSAEDRYVLNRTTLGLDGPLDAATLTVELQYDDDGDWRTVLRADPAD